MRTAFAESNCLAQFSGLHLGTAFIQYHKALDPISQTRTPP
jgi:hypothetical protein